jgi:hypothetical protein
VGEKFIRQNSEVIFDRQHEPLFRESIRDKNKRPLTPRARCQYYKSVYFIINETKDFHLFLFFRLFFSGVTPEATCEVLAGAFRLYREKQVKNRLCTSFPLR